MTYKAKEEGILTGEPLELYEFTFPDTTYRYSSSDTVYNALGREWLPLAMSRSKLKISADKGDQGITISMPRDIELARIFSTTNTVKVPIKLYRTHRGDAEIYLQGVWYLGDVVYKNTSVEIRGATAKSLLQTEFPRYFYQQQCNHELYSVECGVAPVELSSTVTVIGKVIAGRTDARYLTLGINVPATAINSAITIGTERRLITLANGTPEIRIIESFQFIKVNQAIKLFDRGCDRSYSTCRTRFNNGLRFGGTPFIPVTNIYKGNL